MSRQLYSLESEPVDISYSNMLTFLFQHSSRCGVVVPVSCRDSYTAQSFLDAVKIHLVDERMQSSWPGTELGDDTTALVQYYAATWPVLEAMTAAADRLYQWLSPALPEDPAFYHSDGTILMGSISHERDAFLNLSQAELSELLALVPQLRLVQSSPR